MSPHHALPSLVVLPSPQGVSSVGQGLCWLCMHRPHEDVVGLEWCMGMPPPVHLLDLISLLVYVSPPCASLPCHVSFTAGCEFGWARVVLAVRHRPHEDGVGLEWCMGMPPLVHFLTLLLFWVMSPHHALPSLVVLPSPQLVSSVGQGLCWLCGTDRMRMLWVWSGAWECPPPPLFTS